MKPLGESTVAVVGLGLMGASMAWKLKQDGAALRVLGVVHRAETGRKALERGIVDEIIPWTEALSADLLVLATPVRTIIRQLGEITGAPGLVIDLGSTKSAIARAMESLPEGVRAVGGHPMCGKETSGIDAADPELYRGCTFVLVPTSRSDEESMALARELALALGSVPMLLDPERHDRLVAAISHLPYMVSSALMWLVSEIAEEDETVLDVAASGFRDTSRLAASDVKMMMDILITNREQVLDLLAAYQERISRLADLLESGDGSDLSDLLGSIRESRIALGRKKGW